MQARPPTATEKTNNSRILFFLLFLVIFQHGKLKKKKTNFWVATFLVSGDTHVHNNQAALIISARIQMI